MSLTHPPTSGARPLTSSPTAGATAWIPTLAVAGALAALGWFGFVRGVRVPLLGLFDLGIHELGHLISYPLPVPRVVEAAAGSGAQILVPSGLVVYFLGVRGDHLAAAFCAGWAATSMVDVSIYVADAPYQRLSLIGGYHDWAYILGPSGLNHLEWAAGLARGLRTTALLVWLVSLAVVVGPPLLGRLLPSPGR